MHCSPSKGDIVIVGKTLVGWVGDLFFFACHKWILTVPLQKTKMNFEKIGPWITLKLDDFCL